MCFPAAPETGDAIDGSSAVTSTTSVVVTDPAIDSRGRMCCNNYVTIFIECCVCFSVSMLICYKTIMALLWKTWSEVSAN